MASSRVPPLNSPPRPVIFYGYSVSCDCKEMKGSGCWRNHAYSTNETTPTNKHGVTSVQIDTKGIEQN